MSIGLEKVHDVVRLQDAAEKMRDTGVGALAVYDGETLLGVLTDRDLVVRAIAEGLDPTQTAVHEVLSPEVLHCYEDQNLSEALEQMRREQVRRLVVLDREGQPTGLISVDDAAELEATDSKVAAVLAKTTAT